MMDAYLKWALENVRPFVDENKELALSEELPTTQGATNRVVFGSRHGEPVVFKFFGSPERKHHEEWALQQLSASATVPKVFPYQSEHILVMERLPGVTLWDLRDRLSVQERSDIRRQIGRALAKVVKTAPRNNSAAKWDRKSPIWPGLYFYWKSDFATFFDATMETCRKALMRHNIPHACLHESVRRLIERREEIVNRESFLHCDDNHPNNIIVNQGRLQGFIDLEMSRFGNELYLLGTVLQNAVLQNPTQPDHWSLILEGYEEERGEKVDKNTLHLIKDFAPFQNWIRFSWYWGTDNLEPWVVEGNLRQSTVNQLQRTLETVDVII